MYTTIFLALSGPTTNQPLVPGGACNADDFPCLISVKVGCPPNDHECAYNKLNDTAGSDEDDAFLSLWWKMPPFDGQSSSDFPNIHVTPGCFTASRRRARPNSNKAASQTCQDETAAAKKACSECVPQPPQCAEDKCAWKKQDDNNMFQGSKKGPPAKNGGLPS